MALVEFFGAFEEGGGCETRAYDRAEGCAVDCRHGYGLGTDAVRLGSSNRADCRVETLKLDQILRSNGKQLVKCVS